MNFDRMRYVFHTLLCITIQPIRPKDNLHRLLYSTNLQNSKVVYIWKTEPYSGEI